MRLTKIRISGFKSFAQPCVIVFDHAMTAIVGPNGCGKSNIIDAVRWVLGESSARSLRGKEASDIIFNGASERVACRKAVVTLTFDNAQGLAPGEFGRFGEISIQRELCRESGSSYKINGRACRRKDVTALFLGSGLGPRSYAIIEQGMISRFIESSSMQMRAYVEEAAGVSRYREKRKEVERHLTQTRDNLSRLTDIRLQLAERLEVLKHQAHQAKMYKELRTKQRQTRQELLIQLWYSWHQAEKQATDMQQCLQGQLAQLLQEKQKVEHEQSQNQAALTQANTQLAEMHQQMTQASQQLARLETSYQHWQEQQQQCQQKQAHLQSQLKAMDSQQQKEQEQLEQTHLRQVQLHQDDESAREALARAQAQVEQVKENFDWVRRQRESISKDKQVIDVECVKQQGLLRETQSLIKNHQQQIEKEQTQLETLAMPEQTPNVQLDTTLPEKIDRAKESVREHQQTLKSLQETLTQTQEMVQEHQLILREQQTRLTTVTQWLGQDHEDTLAKKKLAVESGWETAVEVALGEWVCARTTDKLPQEYEGCWMTPAKQTQSGTLAEKIKSAWFPEQFNAIYLASDLKDAQQRQTSLAAFESVITPQGHWLGANWSMSLDLGQKRPIQWMIEREQLNESIANTQQALQTHQQQQKILEEQYQTTQAQLRSAQQNLEKTQQQQQQEKLRTHLHHQHMKAREQELKASLADLHKERLALTEKEQKLGDVMARVTQEQQKIHQQWRDVEQNFKESSSTWAQVRQELEQARRAVEKNNTALQAITAEKKRIEHLKTRTQQERERLQEELTRVLQDVSIKAEDEQAIVAARAQVAKDHKQLEHWQQQQQRILDEDKRLGKQVRELDTQKQQWEAQLQDEKVAAERAASRCLGVQEQLAQMELERPEPEKITAVSQKEQALMKQTLGDLDTKIKELGAVNLVALDEFQEALDKKRYLDEQNSDLEQAITTLEEAVSQIDHESEQCFNETFKRVNDNLKPLFSHIFGGGQAYLERVDEEDASFGVQLRATPPGKRNTSTSLLSGGEKTLAALALVFAFFQLNPAPFCLLDEVDAPLDDINVNRFGRLVAQMAQKVQFVFVSHNQASIEVAQQLVGVTMQEAGVSRVVAVDVEHAMQFVEAS